MKIVDPNYKIPNRNAIASRIDVLIQCVPTRWNSTYYMIERLLEQRKSISGVLNDRLYTSMKIAKKYTLGLEAWEILEQLNNILKPFELTTKIISSEKYPTSSLVLPLLASFADIFLHISKRIRMKRFNTSQTKKRIIPDKK